MLSHGDEFGRTQRGNNNAYCHDSELTWIDRNLTDAYRRAIHNSAVLPRGQAALAIPLQR